MFYLGMVVAIGLSQLQYVDLNSSRNLFIIGFSFLVGLSIPEWIKSNPGVISTGIQDNVTKGLSSGEQPLRTVRRLSAMHPSAASCPAWSSSWTCGQVAVNSIVTSIRELGVDCT